MQASTMYRVLHRQWCLCPALSRTCCLSPGLFISSFPVKLLLTAGKDPIRCSRVPFKPFLSSTLDNSDAAVLQIPYSECVTKSRSLFFPVLGFCRRLDSFTCTYPLASGVVGWPVFRGADDDATTKCSLGDAIFTLRLCCSGRLTPAPSPQPKT